MRKLIKDFGDFINKGNVITIAVGLVMALYFQKIVDAVMVGVINPIIAAIFGKSTSPRSASTSVTPGSRSASSSTPSSASSPSRSSCS